MHKLNEKCKNKIPRRKIGIRCDCGPFVGMGHVSRQKLIYKRLVELGHKVSFFIRKGKNLIRDLPIAEGGEIESMDVVIIDLIRDFENFEFPRTKIVFYDGPKRIDSNADIVFALNYKQQKSWYNRNNYFVGLDYIPMESSIAKIRKDPGELKKILIMTSGIDLWNMPLQVLNVLKETSYQITIKLSEAYPKQWVKGLEKDAEVILKTEKVSTLYDDHDLMICTAGNVLFEAAAAGLPCISFSTGKVQEGHGMFLNDVGFSIHLGGFWDNTAKVGYLLDAVDYLSDPLEREKRSKIGRSICDGKGLDRIMDIIGK